MRNDGVYPQAGALSEDLVPVHLMALVAGHHFAHRRWFAVEDGGDAVDDGPGGAGQRREAGRADRAAKTLSNGSNGTQDVVHGRDDYALLGGEMLVDFRWLHLTAEGVALLFENATNGIHTDKYIEKVQK